MSEQKHLEELVVSYAENKAKLKDYTDICDSQNSEIKSLMRESGISEITSGDYVAKVVITEKDTPKEDRMLAYLTEECPELCAELGIIKTKQYIDFDALESAIYHDQLSQETMLELGKCYESKQIETLRVSKRKKKKEEA